MKKIILSLLLLANVHAEKPTESMIKSLLEVYKGGMSEYYFDDYCFDAFGLSEGLAEIRVDLTSDEFDSKGFIYGKSYLRCAGSIYWIEAESCSFIKDGDKLEYDYCDS